MTKQFEHPLTEADEDELRAYFTPAEASPFEASISRLIGGGRVSSHEPDPAAGIDARRVAAVLERLEPRHVLALDVVYSRPKIDLRRLYRGAPNVWRAWFAAAAAYATARGA